jgi:hypothetical protein
MGTVQGEVVSATLDFLSKELVRLSEHHKIATVVRAAEMARRERCVAASSFLSSERAQPPNAPIIPEHTRNGSLDDGTSTCVGYPSPFPSDRVFLCTILNFAERVRRVVVVKRRSAFEPSRRWCTSRS